MRPSYKSAILMLGLTLTTFSTGCTQALVKEVYNAAVDGMAGAVESAVMALVDQLLPPDAG